MVISITTYPCYLGYLTDVSGDSYTFLRDTILVLNSYGFGSVPELFKMKISEIIALSRVTEDDVFQTRYKKLLGTRLV